jgi:hypothetical protein
MFSAAVDCMQKKECKSKKMYKLLLQTHTSVQSQIVLVELAKQLLQIGTNSHNLLRQ